MPKPLTLSLFSLFMGLGVFAINSSSAALVQGSIIAKGSRLPTATVTIRDENDRVLAESQPALLGRISIPIPDQVKVVKCTISARGFVTRQLTLDVINGRADAKVVVLQPIPGLAVAVVDRALSTDRRTEWVDVVVTNHSSAPIQVQSISIAATRLRHTNCLDLLTPDVTIDISRSLSAIKINADSKVEVAVRTERGTDNRITSATLLLTKCNQMELRSEIPAIYATLAGEVHRIRVVLPHAIGTRSNPELTLDIASWHAITVVLKSVDGRSFASS